MSEYKVCFGHYTQLMVASRDCGACSRYWRCHLEGQELTAPEYQGDPSQETLRNVPVSYSKYHREIRPGVHVDVYDVLKAWNVTNPALQHLLKKALQPGERGHKTREQDLDDIVASAIRARELEQ